MLNISSYYEMPLRFNRDTAAMVRLICTIYEYGYINICKHIEYYHTNDNNNKNNNDNGNNDKNDFK